MKKQGSPRKQTQGRAARRKTSEETQRGKEDKRLQLGTSGQN